MKFATVQIADRVTIALVLGDKLFDLQKAINQFPATMLDFIQQGEQFINRINHLLTEGSQEHLLRTEEVTFLAPIPRPAKNIFCVGKNYAAHAIELGSEADIPKAPMYFSKAPTTVIGQGDNIPLHENVTAELDYEGELAVIIGKKGSGIQRDDALDYVFGYTILNDVTARDLQKRHQQFLLGKSLDRSCPMGPYIVHKSAIGNPHDLKIETKVNGEVRQSATTAQFIFDIPELISVLSQGMTLEPGDIIATGTPAGVGMGFTPPKFLKAGDHVEVTIEKIGTLANTVKQ